ncbi:MAG TPA: YSC84-related protein [Gemmatimonadaceae bacterium]|jgi:lipid-binding SYLF domain-containing protein|nr:YSC84-related protein [Gemmatimonadaceae bacterium]
MRSWFLLAALVPLARAPTVASRVVSRDLNADVHQTIAHVKLTDPGLQKFFDNSAGYAVFPGITKGAIGVGAAHGDGEVIVHGGAVGTCSMTQVNIGLQLGGQQYSEIIFFETRDALESFKAGHFTFDAQASAVAVASGASANATYRSAVAVFTQAKGGLMYEASIGGQKFGYKPIGAT